VSETIVRPAVDADFPSLIDLYNHYVLDPPVTFDTTVEASVCCRADWIRRGVGLAFEDLRI